MPKPRKHHSYLYALAMDLAADLDHARELVTSTAPSIPDIAVRANELHIRGRLLNTSRLSPPADELDLIVWRLARGFRVWHECESSSGHDRGFIDLAERARTLAWGFVDAAEAGLRDWRQALESEATP